jgi:hypothetical protein
LFIAYSLLPAFGLLLFNFRLSTFDLELAPMPDAPVTLDEIRGMAADIGLIRLTDGQLQELLRATRAARARRATLPLANLGPADEPAHVFRLEDR